MPLKKPIKRQLIFDIGAGSAEFSRTLKERNPNARVISIDGDLASKAKIKKSMGAFFSHMPKDPSRIKTVWLNHVGIFSTQAFVEFKTMVNCLPLNTQIMLTMRQENMGLVRNALHAAGLVIKSERLWNPKLLGSPATKKFYKQATDGGNPGKMPIRIFALKQK